MTIMMYGFWYIKHDRRNFLLFWAIFCPFTLLTIQKIKILKKWKKLLEILPFTQVHHKWQSYDIWFLRYQLQQTDSVGHLLLFFALLPKKNENVTKLKKETPGDTIILHKCFKNHDHRLYCSWDMVCAGCNCFFTFWNIFYPFTPLTAQKMKISQNWKKYLEISSFYTNVPKIMIIGYTVLEK